MEECEALCSRLAIMVNGSFKCMGSTQHLKTCFGDGYTASIRVKGPNYERGVSSIVRFMQRNFPAAVLKVSLCVLHKLLKSTIRYQDEYVI